MAGIGVTVLSLKIMMIEKNAGNGIIRSRKEPLNIVVTREVNMKIQESAENYLETILVLHQRKGNVRSIDIANELEFSKPSVSVAMKNLRNNGYITIDDNGFILLTDTGRAVAEKVYERHVLITNWLTKLGVDPQTAAEDACRIEHVISAESFEALKAHVLGNK